jgi:hypothetical protein
MELKCEGCQTIHELPRTPEIPSYVVSICCNWCPNCEDSAKDYYREWYNESDGGNNTPKPTPVGANQLCMPFEIDEILSQKSRIIVTTDEN